MPSVTPNKLYDLQDTGTNDGTWGVVLNAVLSQIDLNMGGRLAVNVAGSSNVTLTDADCENALHVLSGLLTGNIQYQFPDDQGGFFFIYNGSSGAFTINVRTVSVASTVYIPQGVMSLVVIDNTSNVVRYSSLPPVMTTEGDVIYQGEFEPKRLAAGTAGQFLKTNGASDAPSWASPYGSDSKYFEANKGGTNQTIADGSITLITFTNEVVDTGSCFSGSTFSPGVAGQYLLTCVLSLQDLTSGDRIELYLYKNGALECRLDIITAASSVGMVTGTATVTDDGNDTWDIRAETNNSGGFTVTGAATSSRFSGSRI